VTLYANLGSASISVNTSIIQYISPEYGIGLDPYIELYILVRFADPIYTKVDSQLVPITESQNTDTLRNALHLENKNSKEVIPAKQVRVLNDLSQWRLIFSSDRFVFGGTYELKLTDGLLFDSKGNRVVLPSTNHQYTMQEIDITCGGKGTFNPALQICDCDPDHHRTGYFCDRCVSGYDPDKAGNCVLVETCTLYTCGCYGPLEICDPIGNCTDDPTNPLNRITCQCPPQFSGPRCEYCQLGYTGYPLCRKTCSPPCQHGTCDNNTLTCVCNLGFSGPSCTEMLVISHVTVIVGILAAGVILCLIAFGVYRVAKRPKVDTFIIEDSADIQMDEGDETQKLEITDNEDDNTLLDNDV